MKYQVELGRCRRAQPLVVKTIRLGAGQSCESLEMTNSCTVYTTGFGLTSSKSGKRLTPRICPGSRYNVDVKLISGYESKKSCKTFFSLPSTKIVHLVRDPRARYNSLLRLQNDFPKALEVDTTTQKKELNINLKLYFVELRRSSTALASGSCRTWA